MRRIICPPPLGLDEARQLGVCRVCRQQAGPRRIDGQTDTFRLNFGQEFAHGSCLARLARQQELDRVRDD